MNHYRIQTQQSFAAHRALWITLCTWTASYQNGRHIFSSHLMLCFTIHVFGRGRKDGCRGRSRRPLWNHKGMFERVLSKWCCKRTRSQGWILPIPGEVPWRARDVLQIHCRCNNGPQPVIQELYMQNAAPCFHMNHLCCFEDEDSPSLSFGFMVSDCISECLDLVFSLDAARTRAHAACTLFRPSLCVFGTFLFLSVGILQHVCVHTSLIALRGWRTLLLCLSSL